MEISIVFTILFFITFSSLMDMLLIFLLPTPNFHSGLLTPIDMVEAQLVHICKYIIIIFKPKLGWGGCDRKKFMRENN